MHGDGTVDLFRPVQWSARLVNSVAMVQEHSEVHRREACRELVTQRETERDRERERERERERDRETETERDTQ